MIPFHYPPGTKAKLDHALKRQEHVVSQSSKAMEHVMKSAVTTIMDHWESTGRWHAPSLHSMEGVMLEFYHSVITEAFHSSQSYAKVAVAKVTVKKLSAPSKWPTGIPRHLTGLEKIFRDKRYWPKIMKRSSKIVDRVRKQYLTKLYRKFSEIIPALTDGVITPAEARSALMDTWNASKSRVELIFRTETTTYFGKTQTSFFKDNDNIIGFLFDSIPDRGRTDWCRSRHGLVYRPSTKLLAQNTPACHWGCRSHLIPLANTAYNRKLLDDPQRDPSNRKVAPLPPGWRK